MSSSPPLVACWLDQDIGVAGNHLELKERFKSVSDRIVQWHSFDCGDKFNDFLDSNPNVRLVTIMSGGFARQLVTPRSHLNALHSVYILCINKEKCRSLAATEPKIKGVFDSENDLFQKMRNDLQQNV